jgi:hypothetical protein
MILLHQYTLKEAALIGRQFFSTHYGRTYRSPAIHPSIHPLEHSRLNQELQGLVSEWKRSREVAVAGCIKVLAGCEFKHLGLAGSHAISVKLTSNEGSPPRLYHFMKM